MTTDDRDPRDPRDSDHRGDDRSSAREDADRPGRLGGRVQPLQPPPSLEHRVLRSLEERGLVTPDASSLTTPRWWRGLSMLAAAALIFIAGGLAERTRAGTAANGEETPRFALLLYGGPTGTTPDQEAELVAEYGGWARELASRGRLVSGEKLGDAAIELGAAAGPPAGRGSTGDDRLPALAGFFIIGASDLREAEEIAATMPHLRHGGRVIVRPIEPT